MWSLCKNITTERNKFEDTVVERQNCSALVHLIRQFALLPLPLSIPLNCLVLTILFILLLLLLLLLFFLSLLLLLATVSFSMSR